MTSLLMKLLIVIAGRSLLYRAGRALYFFARSETPNDMRQNGEFLIQRCVLEAWKKQNAPKDRLVVFDVGANIGDWSASFLGLLSEAKISDAVDLYAFEPVPSTADILRKNLGEQHDCLHYELTALSSESGVASIFVGDGLGINSLHENSYMRSREVQVAITKASTVDFCKNRKIQKIHLLKCDTEGHDMEVIRGAMPLLQGENISVLQFEYNHRWIISRNFLRDAFVAIEGSPYVLVKLQASHLLVLPEWHPELERFIDGNYALVLKSALVWFPTKTVAWDRSNAMAIN